MVHRRADHIIGIPHPDHIGIGEVGSDHRVLVFPVALVAHHIILIVSMGPVFRVIVGIPVHTGLGTGLGIATKRGHHLLLIQ